MPPQALSVQVMCDRGTTMLSQTKDGKTEVLIAALTTAAIMKPSTTNQPTTNQPTNQPTTNQPTNNTQPTTTILCKGDS